MLSPVLLSLRSLLLPGSELWFRLTWSARCMHQTWFIPTNEPLFCSPSQVLPWSDERFSVAWHFKKNCFNQDPPECERVPTSFGCSRSKFLVVAFEFPWYQINLTQQQLSEGLASYKTKILRKSGKMSRRNIDGKTGIVTIFPKAKEPPSPKIKFPQHTIFCCLRAWKINTCKKQRKCCMFKLKMPPKSSFVPFFVVRWNFFDEFVGRMLYHHSFIFNGQSRGCC